EVEGKQPIFVDTIQPAVRRLYSLIPDDPSMFNRRFMVQLRVMQSNSSSNVQSAIIGNYLIETQSNNFVRTGGNPISIAPSVLDLDSTGEGVFKVFNNDTVPHFIICYSAIPEIEPKGVAVSVSPGYSIGDPVQFVASQQSFIIEPDSEKKLFISMPNEEYRASVQGKVEAILWIKDPSNTNSSRFIRLHWNSE
ncbi:hypothetical protein KAH81_07015, partial [bacterium]|nr:hypothetical protein [bacterium]